MPNGKPRTNKRAKRLSRATVPRSVKGQQYSIVVRGLNAGNLVRPLSDGGGTLGIVPANVLDWGSLQVLFARFKLLKVDTHFTLSGEVDTTPAYPTLVVYHDMVNAGSPASLAEAYMKQGVKFLEFNASKAHHVVSYRPFVWLDNAFRTSKPSSEVDSSTATGNIPNFSSISYFGLNFNTGVGSPSINVTQVFTFAFSQPI